MGHVRRRRALSELVGTLLMVGITLVAGFAIFGFVNGQAGVSENQYGESVANNVNYLRENFVLVNVQFSYNGAACSLSGGQHYCNQVAVSIYNNGAVTLNIKQIVLDTLSTTSVSGASVPALYLNATTASTTAYSTNPPVGTAKYSCTGSGIPSTAITQSAVPPKVFTVTLPTCVGLTSGIMDGGAYQIQVVGAFGNVVAAQVTASG